MQRPAGEHLDMAGLVGGLYGQKLHHLAEVGVQLGHETAGNHQSCCFVFNQVGHQLDDSVLYLVGQVERFVPGNSCVGVPLEGHGAGVEPCCFVGPHFTLVAQRKAEVWGSSLDDRAPGGQPPPFLRPREHPPACCPLPRPEWAAPPGK